VALSKDQRSVLLNALSLWLIVEFKNHMLVVWWQQG